MPPQHGQTALKEKSRPFHFLDFFPTVNKFILLLFHSLLSKTATRSGVPSAAHCCSQ